MRNYVLAFLVFAVSFSCSNQTQQKKDAKADEISVLTVDELQAQGKDFVGKEVTVKGTVTHVCKNSGARCFIMGSNEDAKIRVEAGKIGSFSQEQMGSEIQVRGLVQEVKLTKEDIDKMQESAASDEPANHNHALGHSHGDGEGHDSHTVDGGDHQKSNQMKKVDELLKKLAESTDGHVSIYFVEGIELLKAE